MKWFVLLLSLLVCSCGFKTGTIKEFRTNTKSKQIYPNPKDSRVWVRSFQHKRIGSVTSLSVYGSGGSASGLAVERQHIEIPSQSIVSVIRNSGIFGSVVPENIGATPDFVLEGSVTAKWKKPWWTWLQAIDLWVHTLVLPTIGNHLVATAEINLYDQNFNLLYSANVDYKEKHIETIWLAMFHGGAYDTGSDVKFQSTVLEFALSELKNDLMQITQNHLLKQDSFKFSEVVHRLNTN